MHLSATELIASRVSIISLRYVVVLRKSGLMYLEMDPMMIDECVDLLKPHEECSYIGI